MLGCSIFSLTTLVNNAELKRENYQVVLSAHQTERVTWENRERRELRLYDRMAVDAHITVFSGNPALQL